MRYIQSGLAVLFKPSRVWTPPVHLILEPTTFCPLRCRMCKREKYVTSPAHMSFEGFRKIFDQIKPKRLTLSGLGESLVNPALVDMIRYAAKIGTAVSTTSSLALASIPMKALVDSGLKRLKVSLDAATPATYQGIRGLDLFDRVIDNIQQLVTLKHTVSSPLPHLCLQVVIQSRNVSELSQIVELAASLGVDEVSFRPVGLAGLEEKRDELVAGLTGDGVDSQMRRAVDMARRVGMKTNLPDLLGGAWNNVAQAFLPVNNVAQTFLSVNNKQTNPRGCSFPWFSMYVTVDGEVKPCCMFSYLDAKFGNLWQEDIRTIWNNAKYQGFRQALKGGEYPDARCQSCVPEKVLDLAGVFRRIIGR